MRGKTVPDVQLSDVSPSNVWLGISRTSRLLCCSTSGRDAIWERGVCCIEGFRKALRFRHPGHAPPTNTDLATVLIPQRQAMQNSTDAFNGARPIRLLIANTA